MLHSIADELPALIPHGAAVVEFGAGSATKAPILLRAIAPAAYVPVDISGDYLEQSAARLAGDFPGLSVFPVTADFVRPFELPEAIAGLPRLGFFPGSTIGNFVPRSATDLLRHFRDLLAPSAVADRQDRVKRRPDDAATPIRADYARFNLNLARLQPELDGNSRGRLPP